MFLGFPGGSAGKEPTCNVGDLGLIPGLGRSPGEGKSYPLQYSWASLVALMVKNPPAVQDTLGPSSIPGLGRSPGKGKGYSFQYSGLKNCMDYVVHGVAKSWTQLSNFPFQFHINITDVINPQAENNLPNDVRFSFGERCVFYFLQLVYVFWRRKFSNPQPTNIVMIKNPKVSMDLTTEKAAD